MQLTYRRTKGSPLTHDEMDDGIKSIEDEILAIRSYVTIANGSGDRTVDFASGNNFRASLTAASTLTAPSNPTAGQRGFIQLINIASTQITLTFSSFWVLFGNTAVKVVLDVGDVYTINYVVNSDATSAIINTVDTAGTEGYGGSLRLATVTESVLGESKDTAVSPAGLRAAILTLLNTRDGKISADALQDIPSRSCPARVIETVFGAGTIDTTLFSISGTIANGFIQAWPSGPNTEIMFGEYGAATGNFWEWSEAVPAPTRAYGAYIFNFPASYTIAQIVSAINAVTAYSGFTATAAVGAGSMSISKVAVFGINPPTGFTTSTAYDITGIAGVAGSATTGILDLAVSSVWFIDASAITTIAAPKNATGCQYGFIVITQGVTPANVTFAPFWVPATGSAAELTPVANAIDLIFYAVKPGGASAVYSILGHLPLEVHDSHTWSAPQRGTYTELISTAASIAIDLDVGNNFNHIMTEDTTLAAPTNAVAGQSGVIHITQHASAAKTLAFNAFWGFGAGATTEITTTTDGVSVISYVVDPSGTSATCAMVNKA